MVTPGRRTPVPFNAPLHADLTQRGFVMGGLSRSAHALRLSLDSR